MPQRFSEEEQPDQIARRQLIDDLSNVEVVAEPTQDEAFELRQKILESLRR